MDSLHDETTPPVASAAGVGRAPLNLVPFAPKRRWLRALMWLTLAVGVLAVVGALAWFALITTVPVTVGYLVEADFVTMPADDKLLIDWLRKQPDVIPHHVRVFRMTEHSIVVQFTVHAPIWNGSFSPPLDEKCRELGYIGSTFRQVPLPFHHPVQPATDEQSSN